eukprot:2731015-Rhodomonas_salina.4
MVHAELKMVHAELKMEHAELKMASEEDRHACIRARNSPMRGATVVGDDDDQGEAAHGAAAAENDDKWQGRGEEEGGDARQFIRARAPASHERTALGRQVPDCHRTLRLRRRRPLGTILPYHTRTSAFVLGAFAAQI